MSTGGPTTGVAVIGCGYWGRNLVRTFAQLGELVAVVDPATEVAAALALDESALPALLPPPPGPAETRLGKTLRERVVAVGEASGVAPEMLAKRRDLEDLVRRSQAGLSADGSVLMRGWRREAIGEMLWNALGGAR